VNHLHFQTFARSGPLPVQEDVFRHNGGTLPYPLDCLVLSEPGTAWQALTDLHRDNTPYNLIFSGGRLHLMARATQGERPAPAWNTGFAWSELAGVMTVFNREDFESLAENDIHRALSGQRP
jgi:hypothetical protein